MSLMQSLINIAVCEALEVLHEALTDFNAAASCPGAVAHGVLFNSGDGAVVEGSPASLLSEAMSKWDIDDTAEHGSVTRYPGVFEVAPAVIAAGERLNAAKSNLNSVVTQLEADGAEKRQMRLAYRAADFPRLHPLQAWRQVVILEQPGITSIGFTVAKKIFSIEVMALEEAIKRLANVNALDVIARVRELPEDATLRWHTPVTRHIRANVFWQQGEARSSKMFHASLPILVPQGNWPTKRVRFNEPRAHAPRKDLKGLAWTHLPLRKGAFLSTTFT